MFSSKRKAWGDCHDECTQGWCKNDPGRRFVLFVNSPRYQEYKTPCSVRYFDIPKTEEDCRWKLRDYFYKNANVTDIRVIDMLVLKGYIELKELRYHWQQKGHVMNHWKPSIEPRQNDFLGKFFDGAD